MNVSDIHDTVMVELRRIAPEADPSALKPEEDIREQLDMDSMDFLNLVTALSRCCGVPIPERDYARLQTVHAMEEYLLKQIREKGHLT